MPSDLDVVVLGSGVIGLAIANRLAQRGLKVAVVAKDLAVDSDSIGFASPWAGATWTSWASNELERRFDEATYRYYQELTRTRPDLVMKTPTLLFWSDDQSLGGLEEKWYKDLVDDYRPLRKDELPQGAKYGASYTSFTIDAPHLIQYLSNQLEHKGVRIIRRRVSSLEEAYSITGCNVDLVINASGLGAASLLGVEDPTVFPKRGQVVVARAPAVKMCISVETVDPAFPTRSTYIIPRPGPENAVVLGGVYEPGRWDQQPEWDTAERILRTAYNMVPALAQGGTSWRDIEVISHNVGLRTGRKDGLRLEMEHRSLGGGSRFASLLAPQTTRLDVGRDVAVIHAYGTNTGYMSHWGIGEHVANMAVAYIGERTGRSARL